MRKRRLYWTLQSAGWGFYAFINLFFITLNVLDQDESLIPSQQLEVIVQTPLLFLISHFVIRGVSRRRDWVQKDFGRNIPRIIGLTLATAIFTTLVVRLVSFSYQTTEINSDLVTQMLFDALAFFILYAVWATIYFLYHYLESYNKSLKYEAAMNEMHLNQLKAQLNPHFIFNALNSMRALVDEEPLKAKVAITQLSNILRNSLIMDKKRVISFNDELSTVKDYLALESIRFEERLQVKFDIDPVSDRFEVPPMMIQTLVENAIKHGVSNLMEGGLVALSTQLDKTTRLIITIRNSGQLINGKRKQKKGGGYGLANTKERLKLIYGGDASFRIYNENDKFVVTEVKIPQRVQPQIYSYMKALIIDDERLARKELTNLLQEYQEIEIAGEAVNAEDAEEKIKTLKPDLLFLDIQMPGKTGFELLQSLESVPDVIFTTAYDEYALKAFDFNALDYLLKPIEPDRLKESITKLLNRAKKDAPEEEDTEKKLGPQDRVFVKDGDKCWFVKLENIRLFESDGNYIKIYFDNFKPMIHKSLNALDERLDDRSFFRASRKHIINLTWVESIESWFNGGLMVVLRGGDKVEVSRRQAARFKEMMSL